MNAFRIISILLFGLILAGCSTKAYVKLPQDTKIQINDGNRQFSQGLVKSRPFFWSKVGGVPYKVIDNNGDLVSEGKLRTRFRVSSIFWPPYAIIYWPLGFGYKCYDISEPTDYPQRCSYDDARKVQLEYRDNR